MKKPGWIKLLYAVGAVCLLAFIIYEAAAPGFEPVTTQTAVETTVPASVDVRLFVVRDERYIVKDVSGTVVPLVENGNTVAKGDTVAVVCADPAEAASYTRINELKKDIQRFELLNNQKNLNTLNIERLNSEIDLIFCNMLNVVSSGKFEEFEASSVELRDKLTSRQIATEGSIDLSAKIKTLKAELAQLEANGVTAQNLAAGEAGYFISSADGYENTLPYKNIEEVTAGGVEAALKSSPEPVPGNVLGKLVCSYDWYLLTTLKSSEAIKLKEGQAVKISFGESPENTVDVKVYSIKSTPGGKTAVAFVCNLMNEQLAGLRIVNARLITQEFTGLKISNTAIRIKGGVTGVYVLRGNIISFRRINIVYAADDYSIALDTGTEETAGKTLPGHVKRYDEVVVKGKNLYDGKIVH